MVQLRRSFLLLRREKNFYCRVCIPLDLRERFGRKELKKSLITTNKLDAKVQAANLESKALLAFSRLRFKLLTERELEMITAELLKDFITRFDEHKANANAKDELDWMFSESGSPDARGLQIPSIDLQGISASLKSPRTVEDITKQVSWYQTRINELRQELATEYYSPQTRRCAKDIVKVKNLVVAMPENLWFHIPNIQQAEDADYLDNWKSIYDSSPPAEFAQICQMVITAQLDLFNATLERIQGVHNSQLHTAILKRIDDGQPKPKLSDLWNAYRDYKRSRGKWSDRTELGYFKFYEEIVSILGDKELAKYSESDAVTLLESLNKNSASTATGKIEFASSLFRHALKTPDSQDRWYVRGNPFLEMQVTTDGTENASKIPYTHEDLHKLLTGLLDIRKLVEPHRFWIPLVALYSGMRQEEICQLRVADIVEVSGIMVFNICHKPSLQQTTKAHKSRVCPVHPMLKTLGLLKYVEQTRNTGSERLFSTLEYSATKGWTGKIRTWWNTTHQRKCLNDSTGRSFHSLRHNFFDRFKQTGCYEMYSDRSVVQAMAGHHEGDVTSKHYEEDYSPEIKLKMLRKLNYEIDAELMRALADKSY